MKAPPDDTGLFYPFEFEARLERHVLGKWTFLVVYLPEELERSGFLQPGARPRVEAEVSERSWSGAWQPSERGHYLKLPPALLRDEGLKDGDRVEVRFRVVPQDTVDVPVELQRAMADRTALAWEKLNPGHRRGLCHYVASPQRQATRQSRALKVIEFLEGVGADPSRPASKARPGKH